MEIKPSGSQPSAKGPEANFTGSVRIDPLVQSPAPARVVAAAVTFEPGARTAWHTHPLGQNLIVIHGAVVGARFVGRTRQVVSQVDDRARGPRHRHSRRLRRHHRQRRH